MSDASKTRGVSNVVLVHGAWVDGGGWKGVYDALVREGYSVRVVQNSTESLSADAAATKRVIASLDGPVILVGHSYGGAVITEAGNDPRVAALVYIAGWVPDAGESVATLISTPWPGAQPDAPSAPLSPPQDGFLLIDRGKFPQAFAGDVAADLGRFMADAQLPWGEAAVNGRVASAAWRSKPSWYLLATEDRMIPPAWQRGMAQRAGMIITEVAASHAAFLSQPQAVVALVERAANGGGGASIPRLEQRTAVASP
jgi:pimeloyl-ACP methyl ester carboxylesterase